VGVSIIRHPIQMAGIECFLHVDSRTRSRIRHVSETGASCMPVFQKGPQTHCDTNPQADPSPVIRARQKRRASRGTPFRQADPVKSRHGANRVNTES
jgi:hypothetical protein